MSIHLEFDSANGILKAQIDERFDIDEYRHTLDEITDEEHYPTMVSTIWDLRKLDFTDFDSNLAHYVKEIRAPYKSRSGAKIAYVVPDQLAYGLMRMFQVLTDTEENSLVCYDYDEADRWIREGAQPSHPQGRS